MSKLLSLKITDEELRSSHPPKPDDNAEPLFSEPKPVPTPTTEKADHPNTGTPVNHNMDANTTCPEDVTPMVVEDTNDSSVSSSSVVTTKAASITLRQVASPQIYLFTSQSVYCLWHCVMHVLVIIVASQLLAVR